MLVVVLDVQVDGGCDLLGIAQARGLTGLLAGLGEDGEEDCGQNSYDRNHHE